MRLLTLIGVCIFSITSVLAEDSSYTKRKGEKIKLEAKNVTFKDQYVKAEENVKVSYLQYQLFCDTLIIDKKKDKAEAMKNVIFQDNLTNLKIKTEYLTSDTSFSSVYTKKAVLEQGKMHSSALKIDKNKEIYFMKDVVFSTCKNAAIGNPAWSFKAKNVEYDVQKEKISFTNTSFYFYKIPLMWLPYFSISTNRSHGFLAPLLSVSNGQTSVTTPYFISSKFKIHYFVISPEFFLKTADPIQKSRVSNVSLTYSYKNNIHLSGKVAPNAFFQDENSGNPINQRGTRWNFDSSVNLDHKYGNYGFDYFAISDKHFRKAYNGKQENYLLNKAFVTYFSENGRHALQLETFQFKPIAFNDEGQTLKIDALIDHAYTKSLDFGKYKINSNFVSFQNSLNTGYTRFSNAHSLTIDKSISLSKKTGVALYSKFEPEIRLDFYNKSYDSKYNPHYKTNESYIRAVPSIFFSNSLQIPFKVKNNKDYAFKIEPTINLLYVKENLNTDEIINEDSAYSFLKASSILNKTYITGYDVIDGGLSATYGSKLTLKYIPFKSKLEVFAGKRAKIYFEEKETSRKSLDYVGNVGFSIFDALSIQTDLIFSKNFDIKYISTNSSITIGIVNFNISNIFIEKSLLNNASIDTSENRYGASVAIPNSNISFIFNIVQNNNFLTEDQRIVKRIVYLESIISFKSDCIEYLIGFRKRNYTNSASEKSAGPFMQLRLLYL